MKVLFSIKSLAVPGGGAERVFVEVVNGLASRGHNVEIMTFDRDPASFYDLNHEIKRTDLRLLDPWSSFGPVEFLAAILKIRQFVVANAPDVVVGFMHSTYVPIGLALLGKRVPLIASEHTDVSHFKSRPLQRFLKRVVDRKAWIRTVPSETVRRNFMDKYDTSACTVPNPVRTAHKVPAIPIGDSSIAPLVLSVGRLMKEKDHLVLIDAFAAVHPDFPFWKLRIVGDGPFRQQLEHHSVALGLSGSVEFAGAVRNVEREYSRASFVVLPSRYEAFGMVAAEALGAGRAVLSFSECAGIAEIVESGKNGLLIDGGRSHGSRTKALTEGLRVLMGDAAICRELGEAGPDAVRRFAPESVISLWEEVLGLAVRGGGLESSKEPKVAQ